MAQTKSFCIPGNGIIFVDSGLIHSFKEYLSSNGVEVFDMRPGLEKKAEQHSCNGIVLTSGVNFARYANSLLVAAFYDRNRFTRDERFPFPYMRTYVSEDGADLVLFNLMSQFDIQKVDDWKKYVGVEAMGAGSDGNGIRLTFTYDENDLARYYGVYSK